MLCVCVRDQPNLPKTVIFDENELPEVTYNTPLGRWPDCIQIFNRGLGIVGATGARAPPSLQQVVVELACQSSRDNA